MTHNELLLRSLEKDLTHFHRERMAQRQAEQYEALRRERAKPEPDPQRIAQLKAALAQAERDKADPSITEREVLQPLREQTAKAQS